MRIISFLRRGPVVACALTGLAFLVAYLAKLQDHRPAMALYIVAALGSGYFGGPRAGALSTLLGAGGIAVQEGPSPGVILFGLVGLLAAFLGDQCLRALRDVGRFRDTLAGLRDALITTDPAGRITGLNAAAEALTGWTAKDAIGQPLGSVFALAEGAPAMERIQNTGNLTLPPEEALLLGKDGVSRPIEFWAEPLREGRHQPGDLLVLFRDVVSRRSAVGELRQREERFRTLATHAATGILLLDRNGDCIFSNLAAQTMGGFNAVEGLGTGWARMVHPDDRAIANEWPEAARSGSPFVREFRFLEGERTRWARVRSKMVAASDGQPLGHLGTLEDVTDTHALETDLERQTKLAVAARDALEEAHSQQAEAVASLRQAGRELGQRLAERDLALAELRQQLTDKDRASEEAREALEQEREQRQEKVVRLQTKLKAAKQALDEARQSYAHDIAARETEGSDLRQRLTALEDARAKAHFLLDEARQEHARDREAWQQAEASLRQHTEGLAQAKQAAEHAHHEARGAHERDRTAWEKFDAAHRQKHAALEEAHRVASTHLAEVRLRVEGLERELEQARERHAQQERLTAEWQSRHAQHVEQTEHERRQWHEQDAHHRQARSRVEFLADLSRDLAEAPSVDSALTVAAGTMVPFLADGCVILGPGVDGLNVEALAVAAGEISMVRDRQATTGLVLPPALVPGAGVVPVVGEALRSVIANWTEQTVGQRMADGSAMCVPLTVTDGVLGMALLFRGNERPSFAPEDVALVEEFACRVAQAVTALSRYRGLRKANAELSRQVQELQAIPSVPPPSTEGFTLLERLVERSRPLLAQVGEVAERLTSWTPRSGEAPGEVIEGAVARLASLLESATGVAQAARQALNLHPQAIPLAPVIERAVRACYPNVRARQQHLTVALPLQPDWVVADAVRLEQSLVAVLENAAQYAPHGGQVQLRTERNADHILVRVRDDGPGLSAEDLAQVAELSATANILWPRPTDGLGVGLALARSLVELQGGTLHVLSVGTGHGTEAVVSVPATVRGQETRLNELPRMQTEAVVPLPAS